MIYILCTYFHILYMYDLSVMHCIYVNHIIQIVMNSLLNICTERTLMQQYVSTLLFGHDCLRSNSPNFIISDFVKMHMNSNIDHEFPTPFSISRRFRPFWVDSDFFPIFCKIDPIVFFGYNWKKWKKKISIFFSRFRWFWTTFKKFSKISE